MFPRLIACLLIDNIWFYAESDVTFAARNKGYIYYGGEVNSSWLTPTLAADGHGLVANHYADSHIAIAPEYLTEGIMKQSEPKWTKVKRGEPKK